ncbi:hypothetical protein ACFXI6_50095 [Streptomyces mirabilis]|uniref:hypothetical protein n=1 Tax=Streptomyces mirabilis TaxID=68239 RepID=UPI0036BE3A5C
MHSNEESDRTTSGLSTEDLAHPSGNNVGSESERPSSEAHIYPGESTAPLRTESPGGESVDGADVAGPETSGTPGATDDELPQLLTDDEERGFRDRWQQIQTKFVDDPRATVHDADALVADVMQTLASTFTQHKKDLEVQLREGEPVDTEQMRGALRRYRSFFNRLLST